MSRLHTVINEEVEGGVVWDASLTEEIILKINGQLARIALQSNAPLQQLHCETNAYQEDVQASCYNMLLYTHDMMQTWHTH